MRERGTQARTGSEYGTGTRGTGSQSEARGVMGRRKIEKNSSAFPLLPIIPRAPAPLFVLYFARATGDEAVVNLQFPQTIYQNLGRNISLAKRLERDNVPGQAGVHREE